jgi:hypothetical protein
MKRIALTLVLFVAALGIAKADSQFVYHGTDDIGTTTAVVVHNGTTYHLVVGDLLDGVTVVGFDDKELTLRVNDHFTEVPRT